MPARTLAASLLLTLATASWSAAADEGPDAALYRVGPADMLAIQVYEEEDLSGEFVVEEDGSVDVPLLGKVAVTGMTPGQIDDTLTAQLAARFLVDPQVSVRVSEYSSRPVQILGAVKKPGTYYLKGNTSLLDVLTLAEGITDESAFELRIQHKAPVGSTDVVKLEPLVASGEGNLALQPGDVIFVPRGPLVYVSGQVDSPGTVPFLDGLTMMQALNKAGGTTRSANLRTVFILRDGQRIKINAKRILMGKAADIALQPDDHLLVKESAF